MDFVDANVIIKAFTDNAEKEKCRDILQEGFVTTTVCLLEAFHGIAVIKRNNLYAAYCIKSLYKSNGTIVPVDKNILFEAFRRLEKSSLSIFDLVSYSTAVLWNCNSIVSYDKDFDGGDIKRTEP